VCYTASGTDNLQGEKSELTEVKYKNQREKTAELLDETSWHGLANDKMRNRFAG
jgi:hypothetical protein